MTARIERRPARVGRALLLIALAVMPSGAQAAERPAEASPAAQAALRSCLALDGAPGVDACRRALAVPAPAARLASLTELLAGKLGDLRQWSEAAAAYGDLIAMRPQDAEARVALGEVLLYGLGRAADAAPVLREALDRDPELTQAWGDLGVAFNTLGRHEEAVAAFEEALKRDPAFLEPRPAAKEALDASRRHESWP